MVSCGNLKDSSFQLFIPLNYEQVPLVLVVWFFRFWKHLSLPSHTLIQNPKGWQHPNSEIISSTSTFEPYIFFFFNICGSMWYRSTLWTDILIIGSTLVQISNTPGFWRWHIREWFTKHPTHLSQLVSKEVNKRLLIGTLVELHVSAGRPQQSNFADFLKWNVIQLFCTRLGQQQYWSNSDNSKKYI